MTLASFLSRAKQPLIRGRKRPAPAPAAAAELPPLPKLSAAKRRALLGCFDAESWNGDARDKTRQPKSVTRD